MSCANCNNLAMAIKYKHAYAVKFFVQALLKTLIILEKQKQKLKFKTRVKVKG